LLLTLKVKKVLKKGAYLALLIVCIGIASCKKSDTSTPFVNDIRAQTTFNNLTQSPWKETTLEYQNKDGSWTAKPLQSGTLAERTVFYIDGTYIVFSNATMTTQDGHGTWVIIGDNN
jgi:hypothetical protein